MWHMHSSTRRVCVASAAQRVRGCNRGPTICAHARMLRNRVADSPPESCCSKLMSSASHCRDGDMAFCCTRAPRACDCHQQGCHGELMCAICICRDEMMSSPRKTTTCWRLLPTQKCRDEIMSSARGGCGELMSSRQVPAASFGIPLAHASMPDRCFHCM